MSRIVSSRRKPQRLRPKRLPRGRKRWTMGMRPWFATSRDLECKVFQENVFFFIFSYLNIFIAAVSPQSLPSSGTSSWCTVVVCLGCPTHVCRAASVSESSLGSGEAAAQQHSLRAAPRPTLRHCGSKRCGEDHADVQASDHGDYMRIKVRKSCSAVQFGSELRELRRGTM